jgi:transposase
VVLNGILYVLRTGCHWKAVPKEYGSGSTLHRRFQEWVLTRILFSPEFREFVHNNPAI